MRVLVAYDSRFGGTKQIAEGIAGALRPGGRVRMARVTTDKLDLSDDLDLLVVGGPTERHGVTLPLRVMFEKIPRGAVLGVAATAFDTRLRMPALLSGSAASFIAKQLQRAGATVLVSPHSFFVRRSDRRLQEGELERASAWGAEILHALQRRATNPVADASALRR